MPGVQRVKVFNIGDHLSQEQRAEVLGVLESFGDVLSDLPGRTDLVKCKIKLKDSSSCRKAPYKVPYALQPEVERQLTKTLELGLIRDSDFSSPLVLVKRKDGPIRLCVNYVAFNERIEMDHYGTTNPDDILSRAVGFCFISTIDIGSAYYQVSMTEVSQKYTAFKSSSGTLFEFQVMPMNLKISLMVWQRLRLVDRILRGAHTYSSALIDDIVVHLMDWTSHVAHITESLERLRKAGLTTNTSKYQLALRRIKCLGHVLEKKVVLLKWMTARSRLSRT